MNDKNIFPSVAIVILNWNGKSLLEKFLPSVVQSTYPNLRIIVGDNASTDNSLTFLEQYYPEIEIIVNAQNFGYAGGYNHVLERIDADYYVLLNSDVEVPPNWIEPVIAVMESDENIVVAQPKIKWQAHQQMFEYAGAAGGFIDVYGYPFCRGRIFDQIEEDHGQYNQNVDVFWASGAAFFIKSTAWREVNGFDADLFAHMEEIDLCWRLRNKGYRIVCAAGAEVFHLGGGTLSAVNPYKTYLNFRNNLIIMQKNLPKNEAYRKIFIRLWLDLAAWFQFLFKGRLKLALAINKAHTHFFKQLNQNAGKRGNPQIPLKDIPGVYPKSIVWAYFAKKIKKFSGLRW